MRLELHEKQSLAFESPATEILFGGAAGPGKALALDTPVATPSGWSTMGELRPGDAVYNEMGTACRVVWVSPVMYDRPCYRLVFSDGEGVLADAKHEWWTFDYKERESLRKRTPEFRARRRGKRPLRGTGKRPDLAVANSNREHELLPPPAGGIRTTEEIFGSLKHRGRTNHAIRVQPGIVCGEANLPVDPYVLGAWLGDGTSSQGAITTADEEVISEIRSRGHEVRKRTHKYAYGIPGLFARLRDLGVANNKHIPSLYLRASETQRLDLLRGLMDTDGTADKDGCCEFDSTSREIIEGVRELLVSLGMKANVREGRARLNGRDCGPKYRIMFTTSRKVFCLTRKLTRQNGKERGVQDWRMIESVEPVESVPVRCIQVDSPSSLFLAGRAMIPTHNSHYLRVAAIAWCVAIPGLQVYLFRRTHPDLFKNHMEGPSGFPSLLAEWVDKGFANINYSKNYIDIGKSRIHLCHCQHEKNVFNYQGAEIHVLMVDELTHFPQSMYTYLRSRVRMAGLEVPEEYRGRFPRVVCASNPGGIGHTWVKQTFVDFAEPYEIKQAPKDDGGMMRQFIPALLDDNPSLAEDDPDYAQRLQGLGNPELVRAMLSGDWDIVAGGMFDDIWSQGKLPDGRHKLVLEPFPIPGTWRIDRSFDWGDTKPFSVGWWAESDGSTAKMVDGTERTFPPGTLFRIAEYYGWNGKPNEGTRKTVTEIAKEILRIEADELPWGKRVKPGPADSSIFDVESGRCLADDMARVGVRWERADKSPGSRKTGAQELRKRLLAGLRHPMEEPGLFCFSTCRQFVRTVPTLPRKERDPDDVDSDAEDHVYDEVRYRCRAVKREIRVHPHRIGV